MRTANFAAVAAEEMMANSIRYGGKSVHWIDVNLVVEEEEMRLRIRDNGIPFNPVEYRFDSGEYEIHGIELVKRMSSHVDYMRTMDMNNTIIAFQRQEEKDGKQKR